MEEEEEKEEKEELEGKSGCFGYVFARLPRIARGVFRGLFVFGGPFSASMVCELLQTNDKRAVEEALSILCTCDFISEDTRKIVVAADPAFRDNLDDERYKEKDKKDNETSKMAAVSKGHHHHVAASSIMSAKRESLWSIFARDDQDRRAQTLIQKSTKCRRYLMNASQWKFCYLLNRVRKRPSSSRLQGGKISSSYGDRFMPDSSLSIPMVPPLGALNGETVNIAHKEVLFIAQLHQASIPCAVGLALTIRSDAVSWFHGPGLSLLGFVAKNQEVQILRQQRLERHLRKKTQQRGKEGIRTHENEVGDDDDDLNDAASDDNSSSSSRSSNAENDDEDILIFGDARLGLLCPENLHRGALPLSSFAPRSAANKIDWKGKSTEWKFLDKRERAVVVYAARRARGWLGIASAYEETEQYQQGFESFSAAFGNLKINLDLAAVPKQNAYMDYAAWHLKCIVGLCKSAARTKGIHLSIKYLEKAVKLIAPLARANPIATNKFSLLPSSRILTNQNRRKERQERSLSLWIGLARLKTLSIELHTKMGAFQNAIDDREEVGKICRLIGNSVSTSILCEAELSIGDTYLRLGMWEDARLAFSVVYNNSFRAAIGDRPLSITNRWRARALSGRADANMKSGAFYEQNRDVQELKVLLTQSDEPLLRQEILHSRGKSVNAAVEKMR
eukprot:jgi/Bigna1/144754/aug1.91_g19462